MITNSSRWQQWRDFLARVWHLTLPYWRSEEKWSARLLLGTIVALNYLIVELAVWYSNWNRDFFNLMDEERWGDFWMMLAQFAAIMLVFTSVDLLEDYLRRTLHIRWRRWLTLDYLERWLSGRKLYRQQFHPEATDNPDQRISNDIHQFCERTMAMSLQLLRTVTSLFSFTIILWNLSGSLEFDWADSHWVIPGYMVWVALLYSVFGTWITHKVARPLAQLNFQQEHREADFRFHLMRVREHAESVMLQQGESAEKKRAVNLFGKIWHNWNRLTRVKLQFSAMNSGYNEVARIFPYLVAAPRMMSGALQLGDMMQTATGFYRVQEAFSWFVDAYEQVSEWWAVTDRLISFSDQIDGLEDTTPEQPSDLPGWSSLTLSDPQQKLLFSAPELFLTGHTLIRGPSGSGKSTLMRSLAGLWPFHEGQVHLPDHRQCMFVPQKAYLPHATLSEILCYPHPSGDWSDDECLSALKQAELPHLTEELNNNQNWQQRLSGGETQRLMIARVLLQKPRWLFLDEALSALDEDSRHRLEQVLHTTLPDTKVVMISHQPSASQ
ncbi:ABC transporter ATP-binding protein/permease [Endozoicomonas gorgoniicola]|uniref:ABC transporter ATP-binding protein/permease n=1 Tax=Endozoicomonas gorgoniicola TaxID=1234144 RepID=A0ABT3MSX1_9GAMM|nr:ABC transporter ATP-binding protein/permease [Endozoicomonas gorgoniicola]MCW7552469.1 ABC transporter ATP-binding protein/permease [Endozoicomonas gorgoniicola]